MSCVCTVILCCRNTTTKTVLCMTKVRNLKVGSMWSKRHGKHVQALHCLPVISPSQRTPCVLVLILFFSPELSIHFFCFHFSLYFPLFLCSFHDQESSMQLWTRLNPNAHQNACWDYLFHSSNIFVSTKVSLKYNLNIPLCNFRPCTEEIV